MLASMMCLLCLNALWVTHIRHDEKLVTLAILFGLRPVGVVSNIHPSRRNLVTQHFYLTYTLLEGFCQVFCLVSNIHPSRQNLVTQHFYLTYTLLEGFCQVFCLVSNIHPLRRNLVTQCFYYTLLKGFCQVIGPVSNIHPSRRNLVTQCFCWQQGLLRRHQKNNSFINFQNEEIHLIHLLVIFLQVFNVPWTREPSSDYSFKVITASSGVMDDSVWSFPSGPQLSLDGIFCSRGDFVQNEVPYVKMSQFHSLIVVFNHLSLVFCHFAGSLFSHFVQTVQVNPQLVIILFFTERCSSSVGYFYFDRDHYFGSISQPERRFPRWCPHCSLIRPKDIRQFIWPSALSFIQLSLDNPEQCPVCHFCLSVRLWVPW